MAARKARATSSSQVTTDPEEIRAWVEARGGTPAIVKRTRRGDTGVLRIDFPGFSGEGSLEPITWDEFFETFEKSGLDFLYQDRTSNGRISRFNKFVTREGSEGEQSSKPRGAGRRARKSAAASAEGEGKTTGARGGRKKTGTSTRGGAAKKTAPRASRTAGARRGSGPRSEDSASRTRSARSTSKTRSTSNTRSASKARTATKARATKQARATKKARATGGTRGRAKTSRATKG